VVADRGTTTDEALIEDDVGIARDRVEYSWEEEWYPMYLTAEMPSNSPLGLTVFDRSLVLFYDGDGKIHCFEDRCPHRCNIFLAFCTFKFLNSQFFFRVL
jgi:phenylpropionate dioxygenase-like ring-hydroxylating dioxygenase large terminal subunit